MILPALLNLILSLLPSIMPLVNVLLDLLQNVVMPLLPPLLSIVEAILPAIGPLLTMVLSSLQPVFDLLQMLAPVLATIVGWIAKIVGWVADGLSWVVDLIFGEESGKVAETAKVNGYATGGFTDGLSIAGEDPLYPIEAVISFNPAYREQNLSYWAKAGRMLGADATDFALSSGDSSTFVDFGGIVFAPNIQITGHADEESIMAAIEKEYPEFIDFLEEWFAKRGAPIYG